MKSSLITPATFLLIAACCSPIAPRAAADVPSMIWPKDASTPTWVAESEATRDGEPNWEFFDDIAAARLREKIDRHHARTDAERALPDSTGDADAIRSRCVWIGSAGTGLAAPGTFKASDSLEALTTHAESIFVARVEEQRAGFLGAIPGILYRIKVQRVVASSSETLRPGNEELLFYPEAMVKLGDEYVCSTTGREFAKPSTDRRILVFEYPDERIAGGSILKPSPEHVVFDLPTGRLSYPRLLQSNLQATSIRGALGHDESMEQLLTAVEDHFGEAGAQW